MPEGSHLLSIPQSHFSSVTKGIVAEKKNPEEDRLRLLFIGFVVLVFRIKNQKQTPRPGRLPYVLFGSFSFRKEKEHNLVSSEPSGSGDTKKEEL